jgi:hypothetical protein
MEKSTQTQSWKIIQLRVVVRDMDKAVKGSLFNGLKLIFKLGSYPLVVVCNKD